MRVLFISGILARLLPGAIDEKEYPFRDIFMWTEATFGDRQPKEFIDRPTKKPADDVVAAFKKMLSDLGMKIPFDITGLEKQLKNKQSADLLKKATRRFLDENYGGTGAEIERYIPSDYKAWPETHPEIMSSTLGDFFRALNKEWLEMAREKPPLKSGVSTHLDLPHPFFVPGGRFREMYYWDSYWIIKGLLHTGMDRSAVWMIENFIYIVEKLGFIPNGSRIYYTNRTQPPMFPQMLLLLYRYSRYDHARLVLGRGLQAAIKEYGWLQANRSKTITMDDKSKIQLNFYGTRSKYPRPESFYTDTMLADKRLERMKKAGADKPANDRPGKVKKQNEDETEESEEVKSAEKDLELIKKLEGHKEMCRAERLENEVPDKTAFDQCIGRMGADGRISGKRQDDGHEDKNDAHSISEETALLFSNIRSAAESGWDFSSRWTSAGENDLSKIDMMNIIPVDLNAIMYMNERIIAFLLAESGDHAQAAQFRKSASARHSAMNRLLWNPSANAWNDYNIASREHNTSRFYFSNIMPMLYDMAPPRGISYYSILSRYHMVLFGYQGGIPASGRASVHSTEQWDFPNVWAPHQDMMVDFLQRKNENELAYHVARSFSDNVLAGFRKNSVFYEKYHCSRLGSTGWGGEYPPQTGFGWTNGVEIGFIVNFWERLEKSFDHLESYKSIIEYLRENEGNLKINRRMPLRKNQKI